MGKASQIGEADISRGRRDAGAGLLRRPEGFQGQGLGSTLIRAVLDRCDADGMPAYLEATSEDNRRLYAQHGFVDTQQIVIRDSPPLFCMWRDPQ